MVTAVRDEQLLKDLTRARKLIANPRRWIQHQLARRTFLFGLILDGPTEPDDWFAGAFCALGAADHVVGNPSRFKGAEKAARYARKAAIMAALHTAATRVYGEMYYSVIRVNDHLGHAAVLRVYDEAIARAEAGA